MISDHFVFVDQGLVIAEDVVYNGTAVSMGNPHFVTCRIYGQPAFCNFC